MHDLLSCLKAETPPEERGPAATPPARQLPCGNPGMEGQAPVGPPLVPREQQTLSTSRPGAARGDPDPPDPKGSRLRGLWVGPGRHGCQGRRPPRDQETQAPVTLRPAQAAERSAGASSLKGFGVRPPSAPDAARGLRLRPRGARGPAAGGRDRPAPPPPPRGAGRASAHSLAGRPGSGRARPVWTLRGPGAGGGGGDYTPQGGAHSPRPPPPPAASAAPAPARPAAPLPPPRLCGAAPGRRLERRGIDGRPQLRHCACAPPGGAQCAARSASPEERPRRPGGAAPAGVQTHLRAPRSVPPRPRPPGARGARWLASTSEPGVTL